MSTNGGSLFHLVARPSIKNRQDLRGKIVGSSRIGAGTDFVLRRILDKAGLVPGKDVFLIATGLSESEKRILIMLQGKKMTVLGDLRDFGIPVPGSEFVATKDFVKDHRARLKNFLMSYSEGIFLGRRNKELVHQVFKKYMRIEDSKPLGIRLQNAISSKHTGEALSERRRYPGSDRGSLSDHSQAKRMKVADFIDMTPMKEIENMGFFERIQR